MSTTYSHTRISVVDEDNNVEVFYPENTGSDVKISRNNSNIPSTVTNVQELANALSSQAFANINIDTELSSTSTNPVQNKVINSALNNKANVSDLATVATSGSYTDLNNKPTIPAAVRVKGNAESSYRTGDVNITPANIGLGNVENKSSATIRGELTKSNVTTALGYTPPTTDTNTTYTFATGDSNGQIKVTPSGGSAQNVPVKGLASFAYKSNVLPSDIVLNGSNTAGGVDPITASKIGSAASNKSFDLPAAAITVEYSTDNGSTYTDYGATDANKRDLFNETRGFSAYLGHHNTKGTNTTSDRLRITIEPTDRYTSFCGIYVWMSTSGNTVVMDLERSTIGAKDTFTTVFTGQGISGWSGNNIRYFSEGPFGGGANQTGNYYKYRMTFRQTAVNTSNPSASIIDIRFIGNNVWNSPNNMVSKNRMYTWDRDMNVTFPAKLSANSIDATKLTGTIPTSCYTNNRKSFFGTCSTAAATAAKVITLSDASGWELKAGTMIAVKFTITNSASNVTLNVNSSGAKSIYYSNAVYTGNSSNVCGYANRINTYIYDGTYWVWLSHGVDDNTTYSAMSTSELTTGTATSQRTVRADYLKSGIETLIDNKTDTALSTTSTNPVQNKVITSALDSKLPFPLAISGTSYGYKTTSGTFVAFRGDSTDTYTYASGSTGGTVDLGARNNYRYVNAENVYTKGKSDGVTTHTGTYTLTNSDFGLTKDMGATHTYRYISVPSKPSASLSNYTQLATRSGAGTSLSLSAKSITVNDTILVESVAPLNTSNVTSVSGATQKFKINVGTTSLAFCVATSTTVSATASFPNSGEYTNTMRIFKLIYS